MRVTGKVNIGRREQGAQQFQLRLRGMQGRVEGRIVSVVQGPNVDQCQRFFEHRLLLRIFGRLLRIAVQQRRNQITG